MRPLYHYAPAANWLSDLATWDELSPAMVEDERHMIFSGSAVLDEGDTAGFGPDAMIAIYTGAEHVGVREKPCQVQCIAVSNDNGREWTKYAGNPVIDREMAEFRDPNVFWHAPSGKWVMVVVLAHENRALVYGSADLKQWDELSVIGPIAWPGTVWECPLLVEVPVEGGGETRWLFKVDVLVDGAGSGAMALTGTFDGAAFTPDRDADGNDAWLIIDHGRDFYATIAWHSPRDAAGRPCWIGWLGNHAYQKHLPPRGWRGAMSLPRRIALRRVDQRYALTQVVEPAVAASFGPAISRSASATAETIAMASRVTLIRGEAREIRFSLTDDAGRAISIALADDGITVDRASGIDPVFDAVIAAPDFAGDLTLWMDIGSLEISTADGTDWLTIQHVLDGDRLSLQVEGDRPVVVNVATLA